MRTRAHAHFSVSSGYRQSWILMNSGRLLHSPLPVQLPLTCQSKHLLRTHSLKFSHTLEEWLSLWPHAEFPQPNHLIYGPQNSWRARSQEYKSRSRDYDGPGSEYHMIRPRDTLDMHLMPCPRRPELLIRHRFSCQSASLMTGCRDFPNEREGRRRRRRACAAFSQTPPLSSSDITVSDASLICKSVSAMQKVIDVVSMATM